jgi:hypothetical protein
MGALEVMMSAIATAQFFTPAATMPCPNADKVPQAEVKFIAATTGYSEALPSARLKTLMANNPDSTLATDTRSVVFGVTSSQTTSGVRIAFAMKRNPSTNEECLYIDKAVFEITYTPTVYVSSEITDMKCSYETTRAHEQTHVTIDYKVMQDYLPSIRRDMQVYLNTFGYKGFGPYAAKHSEQWRDRLAEQVNAATKPMLQRLIDERRKNQGVIDTQENYRRESDKCPMDRPAIFQKFGKSR